MSLQNPPRNYVWVTKQVQAEQDPPVMGTIYTAIDITGGCKLISITCEEQNTETDGKDIDCIITKDGTAILYDASSIGGMAHNSEHSFVVLKGNSAAAAYSIDMAAYALAGQTIPNVLAPLDGDKDGSMLEGINIAVDFRMTSAAGTAQKLRYKVTYAELLPV